MYLLVHYHLTIIQNRYQVPDKSFAYLDKVQVKDTKQNFYFPSDLTHKFYQRFKNFYLSKESQKQLLSDRQTFFTGKMLHSLSLVLQKETLS